MMAKPKHQAARADLLALLGKHDVTPPELLAIAAHMVGQLVALQDQTTMTSERAMRIVAANVELGNTEVLDGLAKAGGDTPN